MLLTRLCLLVLLLVLVLLTRCWVASYSERVSE